jgi:hypothetical protein
MSFAANIVPVKGLALFLRIGVGHRHVAGAMGDSLTKRSARVRNPTRAADTILALAEGYTFSPFNSVDGYK